MTNTAKIIQLDERRGPVNDTSPDSGYIKAYRKLQDETFYKCPIRKSVWVHLLLNATHKPFNTKLGAKPVLLRAGQLITGRKQILDICFDQNIMKVTEDHIRGALNFFKKEGMIEVESTRVGSIITIINWAKYQGELASKNTQKSPQDIPQRVPQDKTQEKASNGAGFSEYETESFPNINPKAFPTKQELHTLKISSSNSFVSSDDDTTEVKTPSVSAKKSSPDYPIEFEWIWSNRPRRAGTDPKSKAFSVCNARLKEGTTWREMAEGMKRYKAFCESEDNIDTTFTMQMKTFFGTDKHFKNDYKITAKPALSFKRDGGSDKQERRAAITAEIMDITNLDWTLDIHNQSAVSENGNHSGVAGVVMDAKDTDW